MADIENLKRLAEAATPGPWELQTGCSWRRIGTTEDGDVLRPTTSRVDGHPDLEGPMANLEFIAAANPAAILALIAENDRLRAERSAMTSALMRIVDLSNSGHGPMRSYRQMLDIAAEARRVLGLEVANG